jgi:hypothetical protein
MLQVRRGGLVRTIRAIVEFGAGLADRAISSDPGLLRLLMAARGTAAVLLMTVAGIGLGKLLNTSPVEFAAGIVLSMMACFLMREPTWQQRLRTLAILVVPAIVASALTSLLHGQGRVGDTYFLVLVFLAFLLQGRGPRAIAIGLVAVVVSYIGLYLELPPSTLPIQILSILLAVPITAFASFVLMPLRPATTLKRTVQAVQGRAALVLSDAGGLAATEPATVNRLRRSLARLNEVALAADDQLSMLYPVCSVPLRLHLMDLELAAARLASAPLDATKRSEAGDPILTRRDVARLQVHARRLRLGRWTARHMRVGGIEAASEIGAGLADIARAAAAFGHAAAELPVHAKPQPAPKATPGPLAWRIALRVTLASAIAMAGGMALSPQRWFWAVITTYVVFLGSRSRGDTLYKGVQRLGGTLLGLVAGLSLAVVLEGSGPAEAVAMLAAVFGMYYLFLLSYTLGIFCVTVLLGLIYSLLGASMEPLLLLRLEETAIGAAAAVVVASLVLPVKTRDQVSQSGTAVLKALADAVGACRRTLAGEAGVQPVPAMRAVDRQVADLRLALLPLTVGRFLLRRSEAERPVPALLECVHWARRLAVAATQPDPAAASHAAAIERHLQALAKGDRSLPGPIGDGYPLPGEGDAAVALAQLDRAAGVLGERLAIGALHAFQLEG